MHLRSFNVPRATHIHAYIYTPLCHEPRAWNMTLPPVTTVIPPSNDTLVGEKSLFIGALIVTPKLFKQSYCTIFYIFEKIRYILYHFLKRPGCLSAYFRSYYYVYYFL